MNRFERGQFFEALCGLRNAYAERSDDDRRSSLLINDAVIYAEAVMRALDDNTSAADLAADNLGRMAPRNSASDLGEREAAPGAPGA
jgi:hypothetical protein